MLRQFLTIAVALAVALAVGCDRRKAGRDGDEVSGDLIIFHAGSLSAPFREVSELFMRRHPSVTVKAEAAGTRDCARKISGQHRQCDVFGAADYRVVENLLMPDHARFNIRFATNEMAIAYTARSVGTGEITAGNWHEVLSRPDVIHGRADPNRDPCGYRTVMVLQLAEKYFESPGLAERLAADDQRFIRPKETDLLALLEAGEIDYLFIYRSVAAQHGLKMILLPDEVNLRSQDLAELYGTATIEVTGRAPGELITRRGEPMVYSVSIPRDSANPAAARAYVELLLSPEGRAIMQRNGQPTITPAIVDHHDRLPDSLKPLCRQDEMR